MVSDHAGTFDNLTERSFYASSARIARSHGVAERGNGSLNPKRDHDETNDSGCHSDVIHEEEKEEAIDYDELLLSPRTTACQDCAERKRMSSTRRSLSRTDGEAGPQMQTHLNEASYDRTRRGSIDFFVTKLDSNMWYEPRSEAVAMERPTSSTAATVAELAWTTTSTGRPQLPERRSTLLHPTSPPVETIATTSRSAETFPFSQLVHILQPPMEQSSSSVTSKESTLLHPSSPLTERRRVPSHHIERPHPVQQTIKILRQAALQRKTSTLLHPSHPEDNSGIALQHETFIAVQHQTVLTRRSSTLLHPSPPSTPPVQQRPDKPLLHKASSAPESSTKARARRASILHSSGSDEEDDEAYDGTRFSYLPRMRLITSELDAYSLVYTRGADEEDSMEAFGGQGGGVESDAKAVLLANPVRVARANFRRRVHSG